MALHLVLPALICWEQNSFLLCLLWAVAHCNRKCEGLFVQLIWPKKYYCIAGHSSSHL
jgi:hypothetical protein